MPNLDSAQRRNADIIVAVGAARGISVRGQQIAIATALQESNLRNLANSTVPESLKIPNEGVGRDHDSVGLFQQRPGWGSVVERMTPNVSASKFYDALEKVEGWAGLPLSVAAQRVQRSAFPNAYAKHELDAGAIVNLAHEDINAGEGATWKDKVQAFIRGFGFGTGNPGLGAADPGKVVDAVTPDVFGFIDKTVDWFGEPKNLRRLLYGSTGLLCIYFGALALGSGAVPKVVGKVQQVAGG